MTESSAYWTSANGGRMIYALPVASLDLTDRAPYRPARHGAPDFSFSPEAFFCRTQTKVRIARALVYDLEPLEAFIVFLRFWCDLHLEQCGRVIDGTTDDSIMLRIAFFDTFRVWCLCAGIQDEQQIEERYGFIFEQIDTDIENRLRAPQRRREKERYQKARKVLLRQISALRLGKRLKDRIRALPNKWIAQLLSEPNLPDAICRYAVLNQARLAGERRGRLFRQRELSQRCRARYNQLRHTRTERERRGLAFRINEAIADSEP